MKDTLYSQRKLNKCYSHTKSTSNSIRLTTVENLGVKTLKAQIEGASNIRFNWISILLNALTIIHLKQTDPNKNYFYSNFLNATSFKKTTVQQKF